MHFSERQKDAQTEGDRFREAIDVNQVRIWIFCYSPAQMSPAQMSRHAKKGIMDARLFESL